MRALWVVLALCLCGPALARENYAVLIGADDYPNLDAHYWLKSPFNDVALVATYLAPTAPVPFAPDNITVLTNGAGQTPHNLYAIRGAFADLAARVAPGDFVYLLAVLPDSPRPDAIWLLPGTGLASNLVTTPSIGTADKPPQDLTLAMGQTLGSMGRALTLLKLGAAVGAGTLDVTVEMRTRTPNQPHPARPARSASAHLVARG